MPTTRLARWCLVVLATLALAIGVLAPTPSAAETEAPEATHPVAAAAETVEGVEHLGTDQVSPRLQVVHLRAPAVGGDTEVRVLLPEGYDPSGATRYPVLYLLHGATGSSETWLRHGDVEAISAGYPLIVVMPDGGEFGFYADWYGGGPQWETFHLTQLVPWVDAHYPTVADRGGRALAGDSMGGLGAMHYAATRPDLFGAAASFSGFLDTGFPLAPPFVALTTQGTRVFGPRLTEEVRWRGHNPVDLAENLRSVWLSFDQGNGMPNGPFHRNPDPAEWVISQMGTSMHRRLDALGILHRFNDYGPGSHSYSYYRRDLRELLPRLMDHFGAPPPPPASITYRSIRPRYEVFGWTVDVQRRATELTRLADATAGGFTLTGSGRASVTTAALYEPGQAVRVGIDDAGRTRTVGRRADAAGRLTVTADLGPANPFQQHTVQGTLWAALRGFHGRWPAVTATVTITPVTVTPVTDG